MTGCQFLIKYMIINRFLLGKKRDKNSNLEKRHFDLAFSTQKKYEEVFLIYLIRFIKKLQVDLTISGGCAMNSVANGKIKERTKFKNIFTLSSPGDVGELLVQLYIFIIN